MQDEQLEKTKVKIFEQLEQYNMECNEFRFKRPTRKDGTTTNYYVHLRPYMADVLFRCDITSIMHLTVRKCEEIYRNDQVLKDVIGEDNIDAIGHFKSGIRHFKKYIKAHPEIFKYDAANKQKIFTLSSIDISPEEYLSQMLDKIYDDTLYIARYKTNVCSVTSTIKDSNRIERVRIHIDGDVKTFIMNEFYGILKAINDSEDIVSKYKNEKGYKKNNLIKRINRITSLVHHSAPDLIMKEEMVMLMDSLVLFRKASKFE